MVNNPEQQHIRDLAVALVDLQHGYTMEFAPSPAAHRDEYASMERHLTICMQMNGVKLVSNEVIERGSLITP